MKNENRATEAEKVVAEFGSYVAQLANAQLMKSLEHLLLQEEANLVSQVESRLKARLGQGGVAVAGTQSSGAEWIGVESLSRLRSVVGGRFQNLKKKWVDAGFPLREHRGDRWKDFSVAEDGWLELCTWIAKQGFEARLTPDSPEYLFELRQILANN